MNNIILASASPRRKELMEKAGLTFDIINADVTEEIPDDAAPFEAVLLLSMKKARAVAFDHPDSIIIGADTVVSIDEQILGKPKNENDAIEMLMRLSGKKHRVYTGVTIIKGDMVKNFFEETAVYFYKLTEKEIRDYVATGEPMDKAGAYGIQGKGCTLVRKIDGDFYNVVGFPISKVYRELGDFYD
jgi:septum formation protein